MNRTIRHGLASLIPAALLALGLAGCSSTPGQQGPLGAALGPTITAIQQRASGAAAAPLRPTPGFPGLDPALIAGRTDPMMGAVLPAQGAVAGLVPAGGNAGVAAWQTADQVSISLAGPGLVVATRGLGQDLHAAEAGASLALVAAGRAGQAIRRHVYLDGLFRPTTLTFDCTIQPGAREVLRLNGRQRSVLRIDETCVGAGARFANTYWLDPAARLIRQSTQWVGPDVGVVHLQRLID